MAVKEQGTAVICSNNHETVQDISDEESGTDMFITEIMSDDCNGNEELQHDDGTIVANGKHLVGINQDAFQHTNTTHQEKVSLGLTNQEGREAQEKKQRELGDNDRREQKNEPVLG